jgi:hypothetical protein
MNKPQTHKSTGAGSHLPDFSALAAAVSTPASSEPNFEAISRLASEGPDESSELSAAAEVPADSGDEAAEDSPIMINTAAKPTVKSPAKAVPPAPTIQVAPTKAAPTKPVAANTAPAKPLVAKPATPKPATPKPAATKTDAKKPSLDFLSQASPVDEIGSAAIEIDTTKAEAPIVKVQAVPAKSGTEKRPVEKAVEKVDSEKPLKRASSAAASLPGFAEFAAIAGSISDAAPAVEVKVEAPKTISKPTVAPVSPLSNLADVVNVAATNEVVVTDAPAVSTGAVVTGPAVKPAAVKSAAVEPAAKKRSAAVTSAKHPLTYVTDVTGGLLFATAGYQLYVAFTNNALPSGIPSAIGTFALGIGLIAISQALRILSRISHHLNA